MSKKKIAVLFGGQSSEHVVSCVSAANVIDQIDKEKYDLLLVGAGGIFCYVKDV